MTTIGDRVTRDQLTEAVTRLADQHADLVVIVRGLIERQIVCNPRAGSVDLHVSPDLLDELRRLTGAT